MSERRARFKKQVGKWGNEKLLRGGEHSEDDKPYMVINTFPGTLDASSDAIFIETLEGQILDCNAAACHLYGYSKEEFQRLTVADLLPVEVIQHIPEVIRIQLEQGGIAIETFNCKKDQQVFPCELHTMLTSLGGEQRVITFVRDLTRWKQSEQAMKLVTDELEKRVAERTRELEAAVAELEKGIHKRKRAERVLNQRAAQLALLNQIGERIAALMDLDSVLDHAARLVQQSFGYHHVALFLLDRLEGALVMKAKSGSFADRFPAGHKLSLNQGMVGWVGLHGQMLLANDVRSEARYVNLYPNVVPTFSELSVPVKVGREVMGVLDVQSPQVNAFDENDVIVIETLADQIAVAIENARLYDTLQRELTERRRAEDALRESEKRYRTLIQTSPDAIVYTDLQTHVLLCNQQAARLFGFTHPDDMLGMVALELLRAEDRPMVLMNIGQLRPGWHIRNHEFVLLKRSGEMFTAEVSASLVLDGEGSASGVLAVARDVTERKRLERYMLRTERLVAMGNIAAMLSHEIKNPLQTIQSNVELVLDFSLDPDEQAEHLRLCYQEIERLVELTNRLLNFASPRKVVYQSTSMAELLQQTLRLLEKPLQKAQVQITTDVSRVPPRLPVASEQIIEVLLNLILNAVDAMPKGGQVHIATWIETEMLYLEVINTGSAIQPEHLERIFDPFFTTKPDGTGLGLSISYNLVQQLGGSLTAENLPEGEGVKFCMALPIDTTEVEM